MKFISWNVNGLRACLTKGFMESFKALDADVFCLQETKLQAGQIDLDLPGYEQYWNYADRKGYSGTAIFTRLSPLSVRYGMGIDEHDKLVEAGYDLAEIGAKLADNYVRQIMEDGFFHADPHPGNIRIRDGKIVWLDMGMMGSLNEKERKLIGNAIVGVARGDIALVRDAVLGLGEFHGTADKKQLYRDIEAMLDKYGSADLGTMDLAEVFEDMTSVMKTNGIAMPSSLTMLARGLATIEGVVADQDGLGGDAARHLDAIDELRDPHRSALQRGADEVPGDLRVPRVSGGDARCQHVQTLAVLAPTDFVVEE